MGGTVTVRLFGTLRAHRPAEPGAFPLPPEATVAAVISGLGIPPEKVHLVFVNGVKVEEDASVRDGDTVGMFPALGGG